MECDRKEASVRNKMRKHYMMSHTRSSVIGWFSFLTLVTCFIGLFWLTNDLCRAIFPVAPAACGLDPKWIGCNIPTIVFSKIWSPLEFPLKHGESIMPLDSQDQMEVSEVSQRSSSHGWPWRLVLKQPWWRLGDPPMTQPPIPSNSYHYWTPH